MSCGQYLDMTKVLIVLQDDNNYLSITIGTFSIKNILATKIFTAFNTLKRVPRIDNTHIKHIPTLLQLFQQITELLWPITTLLRHITVTLHHQTYVTNEMTLLSVMKLCKFHNDFIFRGGSPPHNPISSQSQLPSPWLSHLT